jgi:transposase InsO family protein
MLSAVNEVSIIKERLSVKQISERFGYSRDGYYKAKSRLATKQIAHNKVLELVVKEKSKQPFLGVRKMQVRIKKELESYGIKAGRDLLFFIIREAGLLVKIRARYCVTTDSNHPFRKYDNLLIDKIITRPNQVWVSDITYIRTVEGFMFLSLIMDAYSRKVVGWQMHDNLEMEGCIKALKMAIKTLPRNFDGSQLIHHSDRGSQYCSKAYTTILRTRKIKISMAAAGNCYENAQAERLNGILKQEYGLGLNIRNKPLAIKICKQSISLYNNERPHCSLDMNYPSEVHVGKKVKVRMKWSKEYHKLQKASS